MYNTLVETKTARRARLAAEKAQEKAAADARRDILRRASLAEVLARIALTEGAPVKR